jgi:hypothetical protein
MITQDQLKSHFSCKRLWTEEDFLWLVDFYLLYKETPVYPFQISFSPNCKRLMLWCLLHGHPVGFISANAILSYCCEHHLSSAKKHLSLPRIIRLRLLEALEKQEDLFICIADNQRGWRPFLDKLHPQDFFDLPRTREVYYALCSKELNSTAARLTSIRATLDAENYRLTPDEKEFYYDHVVSCLRQSPVLYFKHFCFLHRHFSGQLEELFETLSPQFTAYQVWHFLKWVVSKKGRVFIVSISSHDQAMIGNIVYAYLAEELKIPLAMIPTNQWFAQVKAKVEANK